jgi:hypothetical protein
LRRFFWHGNTGKSGQVFNGFYKIQMTEIHYKTDGIATGAATKTMKKLFTAVYRKTGGFFSMKRASGNVIRAGLFEGNVRID